MTSITIPSSVTSIGYLAFSECYRLAEVINLSSLSITAGSAGNGWVGNYAVRVATSGTSQVQNINNYKFLVGDDGNKYLIDYVGTATTITLPKKSVTDGNYKIKDYAFYNYSDIISITIPSCVIDIDDEAFVNCYRLAEVINNTDLVVKNLFNGQLGYYVVRIATSGSSQITVDGDYKFIVGNDGYKYLIGYFGKSKSITLPTTTEEYRIKKSAFSDLDLTSVIISSSVTSIGSHAFYNCSSLTSITIPSSVTSIGSYVFRYCSRLESITVDANNTVYTSANGSNCLIKISSKELIQGCNNSVIPTNGSVTSIGDYAFYGCSSLTGSLTIPSSVTSIGDYAFYGCSSLTGSLTIPSSVTSIGSSAFSGCTGLKSVTIGSSVTSMDYYVFWGCSGLTTVTFEGTTPPTTIRGSIFNRCSSLTAIYVPDESVEAYKAVSNLSDYADLIQGV